MTVNEVLKKRFSVRAFTADAVPESLLESVFERAQQAASNCNVQPWQVYVVSGAALTALAEELTSSVMSGASPNPDFAWKIQYEGEHRTRQFAAANALYSAMGVDRHDRAARQKNMLRNWSFFGAPHAAFFTMARYLEYPGAVDLGIYAQTLSLLLKEEGVDSCMQGALGMYPDPVRRQLEVPDELGILFGMSFGYADHAAAANQTRTEREHVNAGVCFIS